MGDLKSLILSVLISGGFLRGVRLRGSFSGTSELSPAVAELSAHCPPLRKVYTIRVALTFANLC